MKMCIVAARAGSKGLPDKNVKLFVGRPLLSHTIDQAIRSGVFDIVAISSDSERYLDVAREAGANMLIKRPAELAADITGKPPVLRHALHFAEAETGQQIDTLFDLQPTSPLRLPTDIPGIAAKLEENPDFFNIVSVCHAKASPYYSLVEEAENGRIVLSKSETRYARRQDIPTCYALNGSIYAWRREPILAEMPALTPKTGFWLMPDECNVDIDTPLDFDIASFIATHHFGWPISS